MDTRINKVDFHRQVGAVHPTKRVRKPNKDEAEQDEEKFSDQLELVSLSGEQEEGEESRQDGDDDEKKQKRAAESDEVATQEGPLGKHIDIKV